LPAAVTPFVDSRVVRGVAAVAALAFTGWVLLAGLCGTQTQSNALLGVFFVLLWVEMVALSILGGPVWRLMSPMLTTYILLQRITPGRLSTPRLTYPESW